MEAHQNTPSAEPDPKEKEKLRLWQLAQLAAVRNLKKNPDYLLILPPRLEAMKAHFHDSMCDIAKTGEALEFARARYLAARSLSGLLDNLESALDSAIKADAGKDKSPADVDKTFAFTYGGWFDSPVVPKHE